MKHSAYLGTNMASPASCTTRTISGNLASLSVDDMSAGKLPCESESTCSCPGGTNSHSFCPHMLTDQLYDLYKIQNVYMYGTES